MSESAEQRRKIYVYDSRDRSNKTCLIHGAGNSSDECNILGEFGNNYVKDRPTKDHRYYIAPKGKFGRQQEKYSNIQHLLDEIIPKENQKLSVKDETYKTLMMNSMNTICKSLKNEYLRERLTEV